MSQPNQYRMHQLQVFNWGTFTGLHCIPIAHSGFLLIGRSGSGKSTLLDALSALLVPPQWLGFNTAAREGDKGRYDRNLVSYIRGAWADQKTADSGEITTQYLRQGTCWSAIAASYQNGAGRTISLIQVFTLRGQSNRMSDVRRHFMIAESDLHLETTFAGFDGDIRQLKQRTPTYFHTDQFKAYNERFRLLLEIDTEMALKLLHKTQSAKNLGDLNIFLREYMLDEPETFAVADRLVNEFAELDAAHQSVVIAREQIAVLQPTKTHYEQLLATQQHIQQHTELLTSIDDFTLTLQHDLLQVDIQKLTDKKAQCEQTVQAASEQCLHERTQLQQLEAQHRAKGGDRIESLTLSLEKLQHQKAARITKQTLMRPACQLLGHKMPSTLNAHHSLLKKVRETSENSQQIQHDLQTKRDHWRDKKHTLEKQFAHVRTEIASLRQQPSNMPAPMLAMRHTIAQALELKTTQLPFVGELIEVRSTAQDWQGAIERVLHGFALSLLVTETHYPALTQWVDQTHLQGRLVYYRTNQPLTTRHTTSPLNPLIEKLNLQTSPYEAWLRAELTRRFNYACVDTLDDLHLAKKALTAQGQIKHNLSRHEKDDRYNLQDRQHWILGFDNKEKLKLFETQAQELGTAIANAEQAITSAETQHQAELKKVMACQTIAHITWQEIDVATLITAINDTEQQLKQLRDANQTLQVLGEKIATQRTRLHHQEEQLADAKANLKQQSHQINEHQSTLETLLVSLSKITLKAQQRVTLQDKFNQHKLTLRQLPQIAQRVERAITQEKNQAHQTESQLTADIERRFQTFKHQWPQEAADLDISLQAAPEFLAKLNRLEDDGLPAYEARFFNMLCRQSMENLAALNTYLSQSRKDIMARMDMVNESLAAVNYNAGTYLAIDVSDRKLEAVKAFRTQIKTILSYAWSEDRASLETRFDELRELVKKLSDQAPEQKRWRKQILDVRQHVEFIAREYDAQHNELEVYRSGAGKSGGQREKLATTCLAAALRYQLGGHDNQLPIYATVVLDEAFSKADNEFTAEAMQIFHNFGFQMIVATPLKSVMTLEPFIGGACFINITDRKHSNTLQIQYNTTEKTLQLEKHHEERITANA